MAGLKGGFELTDLSPGVNVIYGPNGVGKGRTARAIHLALWPRNGIADHRDAVAAWMNLDGGTWAVEVDGASPPRYQRDGADASAPPLPGPETADRYNLALPDLLAGHGEAFAQAILRESAGGYDLAGAARELGFDKRPSPRSSRETESLGQAAARVREVMGELRSLEEEEQQLRELIVRRDEARDAEKRARRLEIAMQHAAALRDRAGAAERLASIPPAVAKMAGNELKTLADLDTELREARQEIDAARRQADEEAAKLRATRLAETDLPPALIGTLVGWVGQLKELQQQLLAKDGDERSAKARCAKALAVLGPGVSREKVATLDLTGMTELSKFARDAELVRADLAAGQAIQQWLGEPRHSGDPALLEKRLMLLHQWLSQPGPNAARADRDGQGIAIAVASGLIVVLAVVLAWSVHWAWSLVAAAGPGLYLAWRFLGRQRTTDATAVSARQFVETEYAKLGAPPTAPWSPPVVEQLCRDLSDVLAAAKVEMARAQRWTDLPARLTQAQQSCQALDARREQIANRLGISPKIDEAVLHALVENLLRWQQEDRELAAVIEGRRSLAEAYQQLLAMAAATLRSYGYDPQDPIQVSAAVEDLRGRIDNLRAAKQTIEAAKEKDQSARERRAKQSDRRGTLFTALSLAVGDEPTLRDLVALRPQFQQARTELDVAASKVRDLASQLAGEDALLHASLEQLESELTNAKERAAKATALSEQVAAVRARVEAAKEASRLEDALAERRRAAEALTVMRDGEIAVAAGWALAEHLRQSTRERHRPEVFRRARELFARVTRGRYRLEFDESDPPAFRAIDADTGLGLSLDELSGGTRVQLLLCVRVAFVEQQEQGARLPLVLDETLANSDESRARQIVDATLEICRTGRQVFYFTAQPDEVGKWRDVLTSANIPHKLIDLAEARGLADSERTPMRQIVSMPAAQVPSPDGLTPQEYGQLLKVPGIDPARDEVGSIHLWHLLDDLGVLHRLLRLGVTKWGQWENLNEHAGLLFDATIVAAYPRTEARARCLEAMLRLWRIGRGRPVDRQVIADSNAVSEQFLDAVADLAWRHQGDARRLMAGIEAKEIPRFRTSAAAELRQYLLDQQYLDERAPLSTDELRWRALDAAAPDLDAGRLTMDVIDQYLATWFASSPDENPPATVPQ